MSITSCTPTQEQKVCSDALQLLNTYDSLAMACNMPHTTAYSATVTSASMNTVAVVMFNLPNRPRTFTDRHKTRNQPGVAFLLSRSWHRSGVTTQWLPSVCVCWSSFNWSVTTVTDTLHNLRSLVFIGYGGVDPGPKGCSRTDHSWPWNTCMCQTTFLL